MRPTLFLACLAPPLAFVYSAAAQDSGQAETSAYVDATPLERPSPDYPPNALGAGMEGWVTVSFVISDTGDVVEPMIEQSSGGPQFERAALSAVRRWKYTPATENGVPVDQAMTRTTIFFQIGSPSERASRAFVKDYQDLVRLIDGQDFGPAAALLADMERNQNYNRYETAWFWWAKFVYLSRATPSESAPMRRALERALGNEEVYLSPDQFVAAAERLVVLQAQAADIAAAMATFERLRDYPEAPKSASYASSVANLQPTYDRMLELVNGGQVLVMSGAVGEFDYWVHGLMRRSFSVADVEGRLDALDIRCRRGTRRYDSVPSDTVWRVPEKWGNCGIYVEGEPGTTFAFREYPRSYQSSAMVDVAAREVVAAP